MNDHAKSTEAFLEALQIVLSKKLHAAMAEEIEAATTRLRERMQSEAAAMALQLLRNYDLSQNHQELVIKVRLPNG